MAPAAQRPTEELRVPLHREEGYRPLFIVGSGRCGTTLLRRILQGSPEVHIPPETHMLGDALVDFRQYNELEWKHLVYLLLSEFEFSPGFDAFDVSLRPLAARLVELPEQERSLARVLNDFYLYHAESCGQQPKVWGDKTPLHAFYVHKLAEVFPHARFVHMIRDGVDVCHSMVAGGLADDLLAAGVRWREAVRQAGTYVQAHRSDCRELRYEDLVRQPQAVVRDLCEWIGIGYRDALCDETDHVRQMDVAAWAHHANVARPISTTSIGKGRRNLTRDELEQLGALIDEDLARLGYPPCLAPARQVSA